MGLHAFNREPQHCLRYRQHAGPDLPPLHGLAERWNVPAARHRRVLGPGAEFRAVDHYVLTWHIGGAQVRREDWSTPASASKGALSLQRPGSGGRFSSQGLVDYGHFYFKQSLICEVADEAGLAGAVEPEDFFAVVDDAAAAAAEAYLARAVDQVDPPSALEMDSRGYLLVLGLLRAVLRRGDLLADDTAPGTRSDLRRVLAEIEARLGETLRLSDLAKLIDMSPFHFARLFRREIGEPPAEYVQRRRTERAVELIRSSPLSLAEIAYQTGFSSQSHMTRRVRSLTGTTPRKIRFPD